MEINFYISYVNYYVQKCVRIYQALVAVISITSQCHNVIFFYKYHINFCFYYKCGCIILKESKSANHIIFLDYLTGMKIIIPENFDFQYLKNVPRIRCFGIDVKIRPDLHKHIIQKLAYRIFEFPYGTKMASKYK